MGIFLGFPSNPQFLCVTVVGGIPTYLGIGLSIFDLTSLTIYLTIYMTDFALFALTISS
nr:MAG TPA: hypothetical protein [Caudoviricetes sp.]